jgi:hypothetical protein
MGEVQKTSNSVCYTSSSEPFRMYMWNNYICRGQSTQINVSQTFQDTCSFIKNRRETFWSSTTLVGPLKIATCLILVSCSTYSSTLKMESTYSSETSVHFQRTTQIHISEDRTLRNRHSCKNFKSYFLLNNLFTLRNLRHLASYTAAGAAIPSGLTRGSTLSTGDQLTTPGVRIREHHHHHHHLLVPRRVKWSGFDTRLFFLCRWRVRFRLGL